MTHLSLRPYQQECIDSLFTAWGSDMRRPAVVLPTGAGKTVIFSHLASEFIKKYGTRVMILVHRDELADQAINKLRQISPELSVGKVKAGDNEIFADVIVASVQTLASERRRNQVLKPPSIIPVKPIGLIITDECHHGSAPTYRKIYDAWPDTLNAGFTATMARGDGKGGLGDVWQDVVYTRSVLNMIGNGYLVDVKAKTVDVSGLDLGSVKKSGGDYQAGALGTALLDSDALKFIADAYQEHASDRPGIVFTPTVETAQQTAETFNHRGIITETVSGETSREERTRIFKNFREGRTQVLANCMVLTEGFDAPWASCAVIARPTQSQPLYVQMVGRVLRTYPGKADALVLDVTGTGGKKLKTLVDLSPERVTEMGDDESLEEAAEREARGEPVPGRALPLGRDTRFRDMDMFSASKAHWLRTVGGVCFIPVSSGEVFLWPGKDDTWSVCLAPKSGKWKKVREELSLDMAMAWGEAEAENFSDFSVSRSASWRSGKPSEGQVQLAERLGVVQPSQLRKGMLSDLISVKLASGKFDKHIPQG